MNAEDLLEASLLDLLYELQGADLRLILGGGYGLYRKRLHALQSGQRLIIPAGSPARSTNDLDLFLRTEVIANREQVIQLRDALDRLKYRVIETAKYYQFVREISLAGSKYEVKIDLLTRCPDPKLFPELVVDDRRVRTRGKPSVGPHAHTTNEAEAIEEAPIEIVISGARTTGEVFSDSIYVPQAYPYLMMKLFAFRDQKDKDFKEYGREHALDLYTIVAIMNEEEYASTQLLSRKYSNSPQGREAVEIVNALFASPTSLGVLRIREHRLFSSYMDVEKFLAILKSVFIL